MFGFLTPARRVETGPLANVATADNFWRSLPRNDPLAAQKEISEVLSDLAVRKDLDRNQLRALLALDQRARDLGNALLVNCGTPNAQLRPFERRYWRSAAELSQSFAMALGRFLSHMRSEQSARGWREYAPAVVLQLFRHRQVDFLLRPFLDDSPVPETWTELHSAYQFADAQGWLHHPLPAAGNVDPDLPPSTLQQEYLHVLLLELMNGGEFSPYDAFWLSRWIPCWRSAVSLRAELAGADAAARHFVVDLSSAEGPKRMLPATTGGGLYLDPGPLLGLIEAEIEALRDPLNRARIPSSFGPARQVKLLRKVAGNYTPTPPRVNRRGERRSVASTVKAVIGLGHITRMLRHEEKRKLAAAPAAVPEIEEITITVDGGYTQSPTGVQQRNDGAREPPSAYEFGVPHHVWQIKDRSASGCRLRAPVGDVHRLHPGALVAIRDEESMRWSLVVVRRLKTRIGDRIDIGVEYVGQNPRGVTMAINDPHGADSAVAKRGKSALFTAVYLRESAKQPTMPFKTLIMASAESIGIRCVTLRSATAEYTVRLKEPIEEQDDFVWLPYEVLERRMADELVQEHKVDGTTSIRAAARSQSPTVDLGAPTDWQIPQLGKRAGNAA